MKPKPIQQKEVYWSVFQCITWLMFQTEKSVLSMGKIDEPSETHLFVWQKANHKREYCTEDEASQQILYTLQSGELIGYGQKIENSLSEEIPALHWKDLKLGSGRRGMNTASLVQFSNTPYWYRIAFLREDIKRLFPSRNDRRKKERNRNPEHRPSTAQRQQSWARDYYAQLKKNGVRTNRETDFAAFRAEFPKIQRDIVRKLRCEFVPEWCKPGRTSLKR